MAETAIESLVDGGKASAGPPLGPALGPTGVNVADVVAAINEKTSSFTGMQVPVKVFIDAANKSFRIEVGVPPTSSLIKRELGIEKGAGDNKPVGDLSMEQLEKIAEMKQPALLASDLKAAMKEVIGTCQSMGITIHGRTAKHAIEALEQGRLDKEMTAEERAAQEAELAAEEEAKAAAEEEAPEPAEGEEKAEEGAEEEGAEEAKPEEKDKKE